MIKLENFENNSLSRFAYGGKSGSKLGIIIDKQPWFLKYPKNTKSLKEAPSSEYIGSQIYASIGIDVHETKLGIANNKLVVACKDFLNINEILYDYSQIKNNFNPEIEQKKENLSSCCDSNTNNLEELDIIMKENYYFKKLPDLKNHFWNMFIVDTLIDNNDRNNGNWGIILNRKNGNLRIAPVYDNGASFYSKHDDEKLKDLCTNDSRFIQTAYDSAKTFFRTNDKTINPLKFIENMNNKDCNDALIRIFPKINLISIEKIFNEIPETYNDIVVMSKVQKELYLKVIKYRYKHVFKTTYEKLIKK